MDVRQQGDCACFAGGGGSVGCIRGFGGANRTDGSRNGLVVVGGTYLLSRMGFHAGSSLPCHEGSEESRRPRREDGAVGLRLASQLHPVSPALAGSCTQRSATWRGSYACCWFLCCLGSWRAPPWPRRPPRRRRSTGGPRSSWTSTPAPETPPPS